MATVAPAAAAVATATLALSSTGSIVVAAVLFGVASRSRWSGLAAVLVAAAVAVRFGTPRFDDLAGAQSVLGAAGVVGPATAAAGAWLGAGSLLLAGAGRPDSSAAQVERGRIVRFLPALASGAMAASVVAGPGPDELGTRVVATVVAVAAAWVVVWAAAHRVAVARACPAVAVAAAATSVALSAWPG